jgi:hypothetical protein
MDDPALLFMTDAREEFSMQKILAVSPAAGSPPHIQREPVSISAAWRSNAIVSWVGG